MSQPTTDPETCSVDAGIPGKSLETAGGAITDAAFRSSFDEDLSQVLDLDTWLPRDLSWEYDRIEAEVREAILEENDLQHRVREQIFPLLRDQQRGLPGGGVFAADRDLLAHVHRRLLFSGGVEGCDGTVETHDTLPLTIYQIGVSLTSYRGNQGTWQQRLFRRDLRRRGSDPLQEVIDTLHQRAARGAIHRATPGDALGEMVQRALMTYAERAILLGHSEAPWRMGHGNPVPYELLTGGGCLELMHRGTTVLRDMVEKHRKFVFVASEPRERMLLSLGQALRPQEYALITTLDARLCSWLHQSRFSLDAPEPFDWDGEAISASEWIPRFIDAVGSQVVVGLYRASCLAPAHLFYAHVDHAHEAAHVALADSVLQTHRGFPMLIDLAHHVCAGVFGQTLRELTESAYSAAGAPWRYSTERRTR